MIALRFYATDTFQHVIGNSLRVSLQGLVECCFPSTETVGLLGTGAQGSHLDFHTALELWSSGGSSHS